MVAVTAIMAVITMTAILAGIIVYVCRWAAFIAPESRCRADCFDERRDVFAYRQGTAFLDEAVESPR